MTPEQERDRAFRAEKILQSDEWKEAFSTYRADLLAEIELSDDAERVMFLKAHLKAAKQAQAHLERLMAGGSIAVKEIQAREKRSLLQKLGVKA